MDINDWINKIVKGPGGFESYVERDLVAFHTSREEGLAAFVIRCLANPRCEGSEDILRAIHEQRDRLSTPPLPQKSS